MYAVHYWQGSPADLQQKGASVHLPGRCPCGTKGQYALLPGTDTL